MKKERYVKPKAVVVDFVKDDIMEVIGPGSNEETEINSYNLDFDDDSEWKGPSDPFGED